jgi:hypothetical protein
MESNRHAIVTRAVSFAHHSQDPAEREEQLLQF